VNYAVYIQAFFFREVRMGETVMITFALSGLSPWGAIFSLSTRKPALPTPESIQIFNLIPRSKNLKTLSDSH
jgi:hypothetical protein